MPSRWTFTIKPIQKLLGKYVGDGRGWIDPFAGMNSPAEFTNDINPKMPSRKHLKALDFVKQLNGGEYVGVLFDPPYSIRQVKECYDSLGLPVEYDETTLMFTREKDVLSQKIKVGGYVISFGWSSTGFGEQRGFKIKEIMLVPHGGHHNDTIVTVEQKVQSNLGGQK